VLADLIAARNGDSPQGEAKGMPTHRLVWQNNDRFCWSEREARELAQAEGLVLDDVDTNGDPMLHASMRELHENAEIDAIATELATLDIRIEDWSLVQEEDVTGAKLATRYAWTVDEGTDKAAVHDVAGIDDILEELRNIGRRNIELKRFKGLGEMNPEELWETTMDPDTRPMLKVTWDAASDADGLFTVLMGENVEMRRAYIEDHALDVKQLDI
jgi:DNA gyrase subunit B